MTFMYFQTNIFEKGALLLFIVVCSFFFRLFYYGEDTPFRIVIADDFISSGNTIHNIVSSVESYISQPFIFDALIVHNKLIYDGYPGKFGVSGDLILRQEGTIAEEVLLTKFLNILCL